MSEKWLGHQDSNLGMQGSKPCALPLGDAPIMQVFKRRVFCYFCLILSTNNAYILEELLVLNGSSAGACPKAMIGLSESKQGIHDELVNAQRSELVATLG